MWLAGSAFALAVVADYSTVLFLICFATYALAKPGLRPRAFALVLPAAFAIMASLAVNYAISGSLRPVQLRPELFQYPGSYWLTANEHLSGLAYNTPAFALRYSAGVLFGENGFFLYCPLLLVAVWTAGKRFVLRQPMWAETAVAMVAILAFVLYYLFATTNYGGCSYSMRWFVSFIPLLWFFAFPAFLEWRGGKRLILAALFAISFWPTVFGCVDPWPCGKPAFLANVTRWRLRYHVDGTILEF
jgi:hypothetical protein